MSRCLYLVVFLFASEMAGCYRTFGSDGDASTEIPTASEPVGTASGISFQEKDTATDSTMDERSTDSCGAEEYSLALGEDATCVVEQIDHRNDGSINQQYVHVYSPDGSLLLDDRDENGDGQVELRHIYAYREDGLLMSKGSDMSGDGHLESLRRYQYDEFGNLLQEIRDDQVDCTADRIWRYEYDEDTGTLQTKIELNRDGAVLRREVYSYDAARRLIRKDRYQGNDEFLPSTRRHLVYDEKDRMILEVHDFGTDDSIFDRRMYQYDNAGNLVHVTKDSGENTVVTYRTYYTYDASGTLVAAEHRPLSGARRKIVYLYNPDGTLVAEETYESSDGVADDVRRYSYECHPFFMR